MFRFYLVRAKKAWRRCFEVAAYLDTFFPFNLTFYRLKIL